ncbi:VCBS repeat-containing protein [uncultured Tateyamaria sp.]|uniref:FG-GAP repeat domain-containing protein n=1 Tax=uncultured Tateyamaria sp. TaxID=455651 RepID=UPI0026137503|nr:VCBS repeat-containing protein [uncultured Tateyamaria sp.]
MPERGRFFQKSDVGRGLVAVLLGLAHPAAAADPRFVPVDVPSHVYDGGWEHFVGGGLAALDCNGDGLTDLVAAGGTNPAMLLQNTSAPGGTVAFVDVTPEALIMTGTTGAYPIDIDNDGLLDLVMLRVGPDVILRGDGDCGFTAMPFQFGDHWSTAFSATWEAGQTAPTLAFGHYVDRSDPEGPFEACDVNHLWRPDGAIYTVSDLAPGHCALSMLFTDWSRMGRADLRVSNDRHYYVREGQEQLWAMDPTPRLFTEEDGWERHMLWGMGIAARDLDRDGRDEVYLSSMGDQRLMKQVGDGPGFVDVPFEMGTTAQRPYVGGDGRPSTGWHIAFGDVNNNGFDDAFIAKGNVQQMPGNAMEDPNNLLMGQPDGSFAEMGDVAGVASMHRSRGAALVDFNNDGLLDLAVVNRRAPLEVWQNASEATGNWVSVSVTQQGVNTQAVGDWIEVDDGRTVQAREIVVGGGHAGGVAGPQHFGVGATDKVSVRVRGPHGSWGDWQKVDVNTALSIER